MKHYKRFFVLLAGVLLLGSAACGGGVSGPRLSDPQDFITRMKAGGYLSGDLIALSPNFETRSAEGKPFWFWTDDHEDYDEYCISVSIDPDGMLASYRWHGAIEADTINAFNKDLSPEEEFALVKKFIAEFRPDLKGLAWEKKVLVDTIMKYREAWVTNDGKEDCGVMVWSGEVVAFAYGNDLGSILT